MRDDYVSTNVTKTNSQAMTITRQDQRVMFDVLEGVGVYGAENSRRTDMESNSELMAPRSRVNA